MNKQVNLPRIIVQAVGFVVLVPLLPLLISWRWNWIEAWIYAVCNILSFVISRLIAARLNPGLIKERAKILDHPDAAPFDKVLAPLLGLGSLCILLVAGVEARLYAPMFNLVEETLALIALLAGYMLASWALTANPFFSGMVRLQTDRGQHVIQKGPYRWIRHPGYAGGIIAYLATPFLLGSYWSIFPAIVTILVLIIRTGMEDEYMRNNLASYANYTKQARFRLFPGIW